MSVKLTMALCGTLAVAVGNGEAACPPDRADSAKEAVSDVMTTYGPSSIGICVVGVDSTGAIASMCDGFKEVGSGRPVDTDTLFAIGSVTKTMTATMLALRNATPGSGVNLLQNVQDFLPSWPLDTGSKQITLLSLATHHSGLQKWPYTAFSLETFYMNTAGCTTDQGPNLGTTDCWDPAQNWVYSNWGFDLLGNVLAEQAGFSNWAQGNRNLVMLPLGMSDTKTFEQWVQTPTDSAYFFDNVAVGHIQPGPGIIISQPVYALDSWEQAGGSLYSTIEDMQRWLLYNMGKSGPPANLTSLLPNLRTVWGDGGSYSTDIGLAWQIDDDSCEATKKSTSAKRYSKGGGGDIIGGNAYVAYSIVNTPTGTITRGAAVLLNVEPAMLASQTVAKELLHTLP